MIIFFSLIVAIGIATTYLVHKAVDEYSYYGDSGRDWKNGTDLFYYQTRVLEKQAK
jgi:hypothetical protein